MTALDVDLDIETLWDLDAFEVYLTPTFKTQIAFPEKRASIRCFEGRTVATATWANGPNVYVDGCRARVGERVAAIPCELTCADHAGTLTLLVPIEELP